jgi:hypothetical protein
MDPTATLEELRHLVDRHDDGKEPFDVIDCARLSLLVRSLDEWLSKGGHLPKSWQSGSATPKTDFHRGTITFGRKEDREHKSE